MKAPTAGQKERLLKRAREAFPNATEIRPVLANGDLLAEVYHGKGHGQVERV